MVFSAREDVSNCRNSILAYLLSVSAWCGVRFKQASVVPGGVYEVVKRYALDVSHTPGASNGPSVLAADKGRLVRQMHCG